IERARRGCYPKSAIKDLPENWREEAFDTQNNEFCLKTEYREPVLFLLQDIRRTVPEGRFDLILCRNVAFTYFDDLLQREIFKKVMDKLIPGGGLVIGSTETLPEEVAGLELWTKCRGIYRKSSECR
ncbi:MAG TPA: CheR family methyltransferase, partial [Nitrospiria bacterium]|nr:CheR family methyltransferase [Nitrospiria bacterium]